MINIGDRPASDFSDPIGVLSDCHRRIERFLQMLVRVTTDMRGGRLSDAYRDALEAALTYFRDAAPKHTADEEESLFPRLQQATDVMTAQARDRLASLHDDHLTAAAQHAELDRLGRQWLAAGSLPPSNVERMQALLDSLQAIYREHIGLEDHELFPLARRALSPSNVAALGREMAARRGISP